MSIEAASLESIWRAGYAVETIDLGAADPAVYQVPMSYEWMGMRFENLSGKAPEGRLIAGVWAVRLEALAAPGL